MTSLMTTNGQGLGCRSYFEWR